MSGKAVAVVLLALALLGQLFLEVASPLIAVAAAPLFYWRLLTTDPLDVATLPVGDITELHYPIRRWVAEQFARLEPPLWDPYILGGHSAIGDIQFRTMYPLDNWLATDIGGSFPLRALETGIVAHIALATLFMYLLARRLTGSRVGGLVAGLTFGFGGYLTGFPVQQANLLEASIWLPLILFLVELGASLNVLAMFVLAAGALAMAVLAGHPQTAFYDGLATVLYLLFRTWNGSRIRISAVLGLPVLFLGAVALAAEALVPAYFHLQVTDRTATGYDFSKIGFSLRELVGIVFPSNQFGGTTLYCGVFALVLVAVALASRERRSEKLFWVGLGILGLVFSFGGNTFLGSVQYLALDTLKLRDSERYTFLVSVAIAVLAGFGAAELTRRRRPRLRWLPRVVRWQVAVVAGFAVIALVGYVVGPSSAQGTLLSVVDRGAFTALVLFLGAAILLGRERGVLPPWQAGTLAVLLVAFDLFSTNWQNNVNPGDPSALLQASPIVTYLESYTTGVFRISSEGLLPGDGNAGMIFRLEDVAGNTPLETSSYAAFDKQVPELSRWEILNVRYIVTQRKFDDPRFRLLLQDGKQNLYELAAKARLPRAYVVNQYVPAPDHAEALDLLKDVNLQTTAVVEDAATLPANLDRADDPAAYDQSKVLAPNPGIPTTQVVDDGADAVSVDTTLASPGLLVLADVDYPGWQATVDGAPTRLYLTDGIIRSVYLPAGHHLVRFTFNPPGQSLGATISAKAPIVLLTIVVAEIVLRLLWFVGWTALRFASRRRQRPVMEDGAL